MSESFPFSVFLIFAGAAIIATLAHEAGVRLGQMSEISLPLVAVALQTQLASQNAAVLVQFATLLTFMASSMVVALRHPAPIALSDQLRQD